MKRTVKVKNIIAFAAVLILLFSITAIPAYAEFPPLTTAGRRLGSFLLAAIQAINITLTSTAAQSPGADIMNYLADPLDLQYSYSEMWKDQPKIQIWPDYTTIDGVNYTDVWLSNEAATKFQVDAYDFKTAYNIASQSNGTFASGTGKLGTLPIFTVGNEDISQTIVVSDTPGTYESGPVSCIMYDYGGWANEWYYRYNNTNSPTNSDTKPTTLDYYLKQVGDVRFAILQSIDGRAYREAWRFSAVDYDPTDFDFDYVSGTIPAQRVLDPDEGMMLRIPSNLIPDIQQFVVDNPEFTQPNGAPIDVDIDPDIMTKLDDLIDIIAPIIPIIRSGDIQFTVNHTEPQPEPGLPDTVFPVTQVDTALQPVINTINNNTQNIIENIPAPSEISQPIIQEIQNTGDEIIENIPKIDEICNNIDTAPYHDLDTGLDRLPSFFLPFITDLRSALGIWHYVTEWLAQISTTFAFVSGCLVGTSIMTPIYAAIAGFMCIKIYRRMTA